MTGSQARCIVDFREIPWGDDDEPDFVFKFQHNLTNTATPLVKALDLGLRGGTTTGSRTGPAVVFDFSNDNWDYSEWIADNWRLNANSIGQSFRCKEVKNYKAANATALLPKNRAENERIVFKAQSIITPEDDNSDFNNFKGGFASVWKYFEVELGVFGSGANAGEYIMLFEKATNADMLATNSTRPNRDVAEYG